MRADLRIPHLRSLAAATGRSQAELIRDAIRRAITSVPERRFRSLGQGVGTGAPRTRAAALALARRHRDLAIGLADASLIVLAQRFRTRRLVTFDEPAFRNVSPLQGGTFTLLPADR